LNLVFLKRGVQLYANNYQVAARLPLYLSKNSSVYPEYFDFTQYKLVRVDFVSYFVLHFFLVCKEFCPKEKLLKTAK